MLCEDVAIIQVEDEQLEYAFHSEVRKLFRSPLSVRALSSLESRRVVNLCVRLFREPLDCAKAFIMPRRTPCLLIM
jgi:hypothetical protein